MSVPTPLPTDRLAAQFYYLDHFHTALSWLKERYADLLSSAESEFIAEFLRLPRASQALLVRLIMRRGQRFRATKINYPEVGPIDAAFGALIELHWVDPHPLLSIDELVKLITRAEIAEIFTELPASLTKSEVHAQLRETYTEARSFEEWRGNVNERVYLVAIAPLCNQLRLLFFGNFRQEWSEFVLADLGVFKYEAVPFSKDSRAFSTRKDIEDFYSLYECRRRLHEEQPLQEVLAQVPKVSLQHEWLEGRRSKLLFQIARKHERSGDRDGALTLYMDCRYPGARLRAIRSLEVAGRHREALELATLAQRRPESSAEAQKLERIGKRLERKVGVPATLRRVVARPERIDLIVPPPSGGESVEHIAREHLADSDAPVYYVENGLINSLFGLLCWEAIFAPVSGAFFHPFQFGPMDLFSPTFRARRAPAFEACFDALEANTYATRIRHTFSIKKGTQSPFVAWGLLSDDLLDHALICIPAADLRGYFERLLDNLSENRSGLPDLVQFWPGERRYRMIEVKGPGDRLQDNQLRWMEFCSHHHISVAVCHVRWAEST
ncbi:MAG: VRR-NUC domain-containing protein [Gammaproteobacteria bacterium]